MSESGGSVIASDTTVMTVDPTNAASVAVTSGVGAWTLGSYAQITAATPSALRLVGILFQLNLGAAAEAQIEVATGAAASEVVLARIRWGQRVSTDVGRVPQGFVTLPIAKNIGSGVRVAARFSDTVGGNGALIALVYG